MRFTIQKHQRNNWTIYGLRIRKFMLRVLSIISMRIYQKLWARRSKMLVIPNLKVKRKVWLKKVNNQTYVQMVF